MAKGGKKNKPQASPRKYGGGKSGSSNTALYVGVAAVVIIVVVLLSPGSSESSNSYDGGGSMADDVSSTMSSSRSSSGGFPNYPAPKDFGGIPPVIVRFHLFVSLFSTNRFSLDRSATKEHESAQSARISSMMPHSRCDI